VTLLAQHLIGETPVSAPTVVLQGPARDNEIVRLALEAMLPDETQDSERVFIGGASRMVSSFDAVAQVSDILQILEQQYVVVSLLRDVLDRGLHVAIGTETGVAPLAECAIVVAPYDIEGMRAGTIGVLGPTRMNYSEALAAVAVVSNNLGQRLTEG